MKCFSEAACQLKYRWDHIQTCTVTEEEDFRGSWEYTNQHDGSPVRNKHPLCTCEVQNKHSTGDLLLPTSNKYQNCIYGCKFFLFFPSTYHKEKKKKNGKNKETKPLTKQKASATAKEIKFSFPSKKGIFCLEVTFLAECL